MTDRDYMQTFDNYMKRAILEKSIDELERLKQRTERDIKHYEDFYNPRSQTVMDKGNRTLAYIEGIYNQALEEMARHGGLTLCGLGSKFSPGGLITRYKKLDKHIVSTESNFVATFTNEPLPIGWKRIQWIGKKSNIRYFVQLISGKEWADCTPSLVNQYFIPDIDSDGQTKPRELWRLIGT